MMRAVLATVILAGAATPLDARAMLVPPPVAAGCSVRATIALPCGVHPTQLQTLRLSLVTLAPMRCETVAVRLRIGRYLITPGRLAGAIASLLVRKSSAQAQRVRVCRMQSGW